MGGRTQEVYDVFLVDRDSTMGVISGSMNYLAERLSKRELEIALMVADGRSAPQVGAALGISPGTVKKHLQSVYRTLEIHGNGSPAKLLMMNPGLLKVRK